VNNACAAAEEMAAQGGRRPEVAVSVSHTPEDVRIEVRDNGTGIPEEAREHIFEPFFTTKPPGEGTGIGLDVCRDIVMGLHRGDLLVDSEVGVGTTFTVVLPVSSLPESVGMDDSDIADGPDLAVGI
jgi:signal transduction histidine kinase